MPLAATQSASSSAVQVGGSARSRQHVSIYLPDTPAAELPVKGGHGNSRPRSFGSFQSRFTTRSARPFSPSTTFSLPPAATFSRTSNSRSRMSVGLPSSTLAVLA